ncbi:glycerol-3-phosphate acyltransferase [Chloroflexota bacterium]
MAVAFILLIVGSYLLGSVPAAYLLTKWTRGIDIRQYGSGNAGASNVAAIASKWLVIPVIIFDIGKGMLTVWSAQLLGLGAAEQVTIGVITTIGHNWPIFLRFRGGRGILTSLGVVAMLSPELGLIVLVMGIILAPFRQVALGVFCGLISLPILSWFLSQPLGIEARLSVTLGFIALSLTGLSRRLITPRTPLSKSVSTVELFLNRLLFDRDIRDRKTWIHRAFPEDSSIERPTGQQEK